MNLTASDFLFESKMCKISTKAALCIKESANRKKLRNLHKEAMNCRVDDKVHYDLYVCQGQSCLPQTGISHAPGCKKENR